MAAIMVLGAGMAGVASALALQTHGHDVFLIDRRGPGEETSFGNAGVIQAEAVEPYAFPLGPGRLWSILTRRSPDVAWQLSGLRHWALPVASYAYHSLPGPYRRIAARHAELIASATADHAALIAAAGAEHLVSRAGFFQAHRNPRAFADALAHAERLRTRFGVTSRALDGNALSQAEPGLLKPYAGAIHWTGSWSSTDPGGLVRAYAALFATRGGTILTGDAMNLERSGAGWTLATETGPVAAEHAVVALGPWSPALLRRFGHRFPMVLKRGYHRHFAVSNGPSRPIMDVERATVLSPMSGGLRVLTAVELGGMEAPVNSSQMARSEAVARDMFALGAPRDPAPWAGTRPCMPDMLPVVGPSRRQPGLWFNFGHGHQGFTLGPTTARLLGEMIGPAKTTL